MNNLYAKKQGLSASLFAVFTILSMVLSAIPSVEVFAQAAPRETVRICHATNSQTNPYNIQNPARNADVQGHDGHEGGIWFPGITEDWGDIIPPFDFDGGSYPGKNWTTEGQEIYNNDCEIPPITGSISGAKYNDSDNDNSIDGEEKLSGWTIRLYEVDDPWVLVDSTDTNGVGEYMFSGVPEGSYKVCEVMQADWTQTFVSNGSANESPNASEEGPECRTVNIDKDDEENTVNFGNYYDEVIDVCPNLDGNQEVVPDGYELVEGECVVPEPPVDVCPNLDGDQEVVPDGYFINEAGDCVEEVIQEPIYGCMDPEALNYNPEATESGDVECEYPPEPEPLPQCSQFFTEGIVITQEQVLLSHDEGGAFIGPESVDIPAGYYDINAVSFDFHSLNAWDTLELEQWFINGLLSDEIVFTSDTTPDLPDDQDSLVSQIGTNVHLEEGLDALEWVHAAYPNGEYHSIHPLCVQFLPTDQMEYAPYCGDGNIDQELGEQCEIGDTDCTEYCRFANQCTTEQFFKIDLDDTDSQSFDGNIYLGSATNVIPDNVWVPFAVNGDQSYVDIANDGGDGGGLAVERDTDNNKLALAFRGGNSRTYLDIVAGTIETLGINFGSIERQPNPTYRLENSGEGFVDVFDIDGLTNSIDFDMRADTGHDGVSVEVVQGEEYNCPDEDVNTDNDPVDNQTETRSGSGGGGTASPRCTLFELDDGVLSWETRSGSDLTITADGEEVFATDDNDVVDEGSYEPVTLASEYELTVSRGSRSASCSVNDGGGAADAGPTPLVLGEQVSAVPFGAADTGAGGASPLQVPSYSQVTVALLRRD